VTDPLDVGVQALARLSRAMERAAVPLSLADYRALAAIVAGEERASRLAERLAVGKPSISATVESLARRGLLSRERVEADQRAVALAVTPAGQEAYEQARRRMADRLAEIIGLTVDGAASLRALVGLGEAIETYHSRRESS
jgi:DNA-binding MarR family transcriptional regulator